MLKDGYDYIITISIYSKVWRRRSTASPRRADTLKKHALWLLSSSIVHLYSVSCVTFSVEPTWGSSKTMYKLGYYAEDVTGSTGVCGCLKKA